MLNEFIKAKGTLHFVLTDQFGNIKERHETNLITSVGFALVASRLKDTTSPVISHMAIGTGTTAAAGSQTALVTEAARVALSATTLVTTNVTNDSIQHQATFGPGVGTGAITEAGLFNAGAAGSMMSRTVFGVITKGALDNLAVTWKLTFQ